MNVFERKLSLVYEDYTALGNGYYLVQLHKNLGVVHSTKGLILEEKYVGYKICNTHYGTAVKLYSNNERTILLDSKSGTVHPYDPETMKMIETGLKLNPLQPGELITLGDKKAFNIPANHILNFSTKNYIAIYVPKKENGQYTSILYSYRGTELLRFNGELHRLNSDIVLKATENTGEKSNQRVIYKGKFVGKQRYMNIDSKVILGRQTVYGDGTPLGTPTSDTKREYLDESKSKMVPAFELLAKVPKIYETEHFALVGMAVANEEQPYIIYNKQHPVKVLTVPGLELAMRIIKASEEYKDKSWVLMNG